MLKLKNVLIFFISVFILNTGFYLDAFAIGSGSVYHIDSINGSDSNDGLSEKSAWASLAKVGTVSFKPGDAILLKRGCVFIGYAGIHGSGTLNNPIKVEAYGEGDAPLLTTLENQTVLSVVDQSNIEIRDIEITAPNGNGILIRYENTVVDNIFIENVILHDIQNHPSDTYYSGSRAALRIMGSAAKPGAHIQNVRVNNCEIYDVGYGIFTGCNYPNTTDTPYNKNILVENCSLHDMYDDAFIMSDTDTIILRNSSIINTCQSDGLYCTAPVWLWGVTNGLVEHCEFAGAKNKRDGMTVDFDDHTDHSTYQYIYSHDNVRFMANCPSASDLGGNTVRYCLSVNDNQTEAGGAFYKSPEIDFKFYNNTLVNCGDINFKDYNNATIKNNIFYMKSFKFVTYSLERKYSLSNNCYYNTFHPLLDLESMGANPQFAGKDWNNIDSFILKPISPCYKAGTQVEENMGGQDFYGNILSSTHSIGCFDGKLEPVNQMPVRFPKIADFIVRIIDFVNGLIK